MERKSSSQGNRSNKRTSPAAGRQAPKRSSSQPATRRGADRDNPGRGSSKKSFSKSSSYKGGTHSKFTKRPDPKKAGSVRVGDSSIRLNKYIANAGVCSRREADTLITTGAIKVNGETVTELGTKISPGDVVMYGKQRLVNEKKVYVLMNKPKDYITTADDPQQRKTVIHLLGNAFKERIYPVGRLDRNTTGLLLMTNDGELTKRLTHPSHGVQKLYHVTLDKAVSKQDLMKVAEGVKVGDEKVVPDQVSYASRETKTEVGIALHSGQNRVVRRIFEGMGYKVVKLDRAIFAGLTKKDLPRGKWRQLSEKEVNYLRML